jgi:hypothetical protein
MNLRDGDKTKMNMKHPDADQTDISSSKSSDKKNKQIAIKPRPQLLILMLIPGIIHIEDQVGNREWK